MTQELKVGDVVLHRSGGSTEYIVTSLICARSCMLQSLKYYLLSPKHERFKCALSPLTYVRDHTPIKYCILTRDLGDTKLFSTKLDAERYMKSCTRDAYLCKIIQHNKVEKL